MLAARRSSAMSTLQGRDLHREERPAWIRPRGASPALRPSGVLDHVPRDPGNREHPSSGSRAHPRQAPPISADVKLSPYHYPASASGSGESRGFLRGDATGSGPEARWNEGFEVVKEAIQGVFVCGTEKRRLAARRPPRPSFSPSPPLLLHLVPPKRTTVPPPSSLSLMLLFLSVPQPRPPGARTRAGAARVVRWRRRRQRLRLRQLRRLRGLLRGLRRRPGASGRRQGRMALYGQAAGAASLPSELIVHIFSFLPPPDRLRASASCSHWRECLFYPALWPQLRICLRVSPAEQPRLEFLMRKCGWFVRELRVEFAAENYLSGGGGPGDGGGSGADAGTGGEEGEALQLSSRWLEVLRIYLELVLCVLLSIRNNR
ncbi:F-box only protein 33 [Sigmodon hispidus]